MTEDTRMTTFPLTRDINAAINRRHRPPERFAKGTGSVQTACDDCTLGVMDNGNPHMWGACRCECHGADLLDAEPRDRCPRCTHINAWHAAGWCGVCGDDCEEGTR